MVDKEHILSEIRRIMRANGGKAPGFRQLERETGIKRHEWYGRYWSRWSDAVREAGGEANQLTEAYTDAFVLQKLVLLTRSLGRVPAQGDLMLERRNDSGFPSEKVFRRLGAKSQRASRVIAYCEANPGNEDVASLWRQKGSSATSEVELADSTVPVVGYVYLFKHGTRREYKIGRTNNLLRREGEIGIQLPEKLQPIHHIKTDDPAGVENYWHTRFACKRKEGEWFALTAEDVRAFKRWKRIF
jgi:hypothetical protein